jgi:hypothetical protein
VKAAAAAAAAAAVFASYSSTETYSSRNSSKIFTGQAMHVVHLLMHSKASACIACLPAHTWVITFPTFLSCVVCVTMPFAPCHLQDLQRIASQGPRFGDLVLEHAELISDTGVAQQQQQQQQQQVHLYWWFSAPCSADACSVCVVASPGLRTCSCVLQLAATRGGTATF